MLFFYFFFFFWGRAVDNKDSVVQILLETEGVALCFEQVLDSCLTEH